MNLSHQTVIQTYKTCVICTTIEAEIKENKKRTKDNTDVKNAEPQPRISERQTRAYKLSV